MELPFAESYRIKMVETIKRSTRREREQWIKEANYNLFALKSDYVFIDLLLTSTQHRLPFFIMLIIIHMQNSGHPNGCPGKK